MVLQSMKRKRWRAGIFVLLLCGVFAFAGGAEAGNVSVTAADLNAGTPLSLSYSAGDTLVVIGALEANGWNTLKGLTNSFGLELDNATTAVPNYALGGCTALSSVTMPGVTTIGYSAFSTTGLTGNLILPEGLLSIWDSAFAFCGLTSVTLPASLSSIHGSPFSRNNNLTSITLDSGNTSFVMQAGVLYNTAKTELYIYPPGKSNEFFVAPSILEGVMLSAFYQHRNLTSASLPEVRTVESDAFFGCQVLREVSMPKATTNRFVRIC